MKKNALATVVFLLTVFYSFGQDDYVNLEWKQKGDVQFSVLAGYTASEISDKRTFNGDVDQSGSSFLFGTHLDYFINKNWSIRSGLTYENRDYGFEVSENVLAVPLAANWHFGKNRRWNLHFGLAYSLSFEENSPLDGLGTNLGIGVIIPISDLKFFIELDGITKMGNVGSFMFNNEEFIFYSNRSSINFGLLF